MRQASSPEATERREAGSRRLDEMATFQRHAEMRDDVRTGNELLSGAEEVVTPPSGPHRNTEHRSSLLNDTAREALIGPYRNQTVVLLTVASSGAFIFLIINLVGVLLCKGYFRKRAPSCRPSSIYLQSLSQSRRSRYSTLLRRFSLESYAYSCCEYSRQPAAILASTGHQKQLSVSRWIDLPPGLIMSEDILPTPRAGAFDPGTRDAGGSSEAILGIGGRCAGSPIVGGSNTVPTGPCAYKDQSRLCAFASELRKAKSNKVKAKKGKRSRSFDDSLFFSTSRRVGARGQESYRLSQMKKC